ncbi:hypothetical protein E2562_033484 [Oryza meyeriana var. granulata]|uniref:BED-type domain-containing protein n=1 Tax=Oryza meyeriana var. granulata TaxID=110450 RepID=A0A6G1F0Z5_9ORYZ|nr:hypothetical protein E2562_033484 [Oryza meyeriana var. granulata]
MSTTQGLPAPETETETEGANVLKRNSDDVGWEYGVLVDPANKDKVKCKLCDKVMQGGIYQLKQHVAHEGKNAMKCKAKTPQALEAKEKCKKALDDAKRKREEKTIRELELREEVNVSRVGESEEVTSVGSSEPHKLGPIDKWTRAIDPKASKTESLKQQQLNKELWKERTHEVHNIQEKKDQLRKMVVHSRWDSLKDVKKSKKGKDVTTIILNPTFWKDVKLTLTVFEPLVKVLRLVDGDVKPSMGFVFGELLKAKRQIKEAFGNMESRFKEDKQDQAINTELKKFQIREGPFNKKLARTFENFDYNPGTH